VQEAKGVEVMWDRFTEGCVVVLVLAALLSVAISTSVVAIISIKALVLNPQFAQGVVKAINEQNSVNIQQDRLLDSILRSAPVGESK